jgi:hypothetical protein
VLGAEHPADNLYDPPVRSFDAALPHSALLKFGLDIVAVEPGDVRGAGHH